MARTFGVSSHLIRTGYSTHTTRKTFAFWVSKNGTGNNLGRVFSKMNEGNSGEMESFRWNGSGRWALEVRRASASLATWIWPLNPTSSTWYFMVITLDKTENLSPVSTFWVNGTQISPFSVNVGSSSPFEVGDTQPYIIGNRSDAQRTLNGNIAEYAMWDRVLSDNEIKSISAAGCPLYALDGMVSYLDLINDVVNWKRGTPTVVGTTVIRHPPILG